MHTNDNSNGRDGKPDAQNEHDEAARAAGVFFDKRPPPEREKSPPPERAGSKNAFNAPPGAKNPTLDPDALYGLAGEIVRTMGPHTEAHPAALLGALLVSFGAATGRGAWMTASGCRHYPNLFCCICGASSRARKTTASTNVRDFFDRAGILPPTGSGLSTGEGIIHAIRDPRPEGDPDGEDAGVEDKRLLVIESELARALAAMRRDGNTLSAVLRECWDGGALRTLTKRTGLICTAPHVALVAAVTAEELRKLLDETHLWNGLGNRILWLLVTRPHTLPEAGELPWNQLAPLMQRITAAIAFAKAAGELRRSAAAGKRWCAIYDELGAANHGGVAGVLTDRAEAQVLRVAMLFALLDGARLVEPKHLDAALAFWRFAEASVLAIFGGLSKAARDVLAMLAEAAPGELSRDDIRSKASGHLYGERLDTALAELTKAERAKCRREQTGGKPKELWKAI